MKNRIKLTPLWDLYMIRRQKWEETHSNTDTLLMLEAYGVYKGLGGKKGFNIDNVEFPTENAKINSKIIYGYYIDMISDYIHFYDKIIRGDFSYKSEARELCARKYKSLTMLHSDARDLNEIKEVIMKFTCEKLNESKEYALRILERAEEIYKRA